MLQARDMESLVKIHNEQQESLEKEIERVSVFKDPLPHRAQSYKSHCCSLQELENVEMSHEEAKLASKPETVI